MIVRLAGVALLAVSKHALVICASVVALDFEGSIALMALAICCPFALIPAEFAGFIFAGLTGKRQACARFCFELISRIAASALVLLGPDCLFLARPAEGLTTRQAPEGLTGALFLCHVAVFDLNDTEIVAWITCSTLKVIGSIHQRQTLLALCLNKADLAFERLADLVL